MSGTYDVALTTADNPYNPFTHPNEWYMYDMTHGYDTCGYIDRITVFTPQMTDEEVDEEIIRAINVILKNDYGDFYKKVYRDE